MHAQREGKGRGGEALPLLRGTLTALGADYTAGKTKNKELT